MATLAPARPEDLIVRRYTKPETVRGFVIPESYRIDGSKTLWELVAWGSKVEQDIAEQIDAVIYWDEPSQTREAVPGESFALRAGDIVQTVPWGARDVGDGVHFVLTLDNVRLLHLWTED